MSGTEFTSTAQIKKELGKMVKKAVEKTGKDSLDMAKTSLQVYYDTSNPKMYKRTGAMKKTPKKTKVSFSEYDGGAEAQCDVKLEQSHVYSTGDRPSMAKVLDLANYGIPWASEHFIRPTVGPKGFWDTVEETTPIMLGANLENMGFDGGSVDQGELDEWDLMSDDFKSYVDGND